MRANGGPGRLLTAADVDALGLEADDPPSPRCAYCGSAREREAAEELRERRRELDATVRAWAAMRARRDSGEISEEEYLDWKRGFGERAG